MPENAGLINSPRSIIDLGYFTTNLTWANISGKPTIPIITYGTAAPNNSDGNPEGSIYFRISS